MASRFLPYSKQTIEDDDIAAVAASIAGDYLTTGPAVATFETALAAKVGAKFAVACSSGTAALHLASLAAGLGPGHQVVVPTITFLATANGPHYTGAGVVFADVDPESGLLTPEHLLVALERTPAAKAVFPVHLSGQSVDMAAVRRIAEERRLIVIEDACHALGGTYTDAQGNSGPVGDCRYSDMAVFSFHPVKAIATAEGGAVVTNDEPLYRRLSRLRNHGMSRDPDEFTNTGMAFDGAGKPNPWYYEMAEPGFNYRIPDPLCVLGLNQLGKLDRFVMQRSRIAALYDERLASLAPTVRPVFRPAYCTSGFHLYPVLIDFAAAGVSRASVMAALREQGIGTQVHYIPVHLQPYYRDRSDGPDLPCALDYYEKVLSLPLFPGMTVEDVEHVVSTLGCIF